MKGFFTTLILASIWTMALGEFTLWNLLVGILLGLVCWALVWQREDPDPYAVPNESHGIIWMVTRIPRLIDLMVFVCLDLIRTNLRIAYDVVTPKHHMQPGVIAVPLEARSDVEIALLANLISLTPGTLGLDVSDDRRLLYVHVMYIDNEDVEEARRLIKDQLERRVLGVLR
jgi:multicomponent Na+:H+ antiporter subunit E